MSLPHCIRCKEWNGWMCAVVASLIVGAVTLCAPPREANAQAWVQPEGGYYLKTGGHVLRARTFYEEGGSTISIPLLSDYVFSFYGEYGVTDRLTVVGYVPLAEHITLARQVGRETGHVFFEGDEIWAVGDAEIAARLGLLKGGSTVVSAELRAGVPIGEDNQENGLNTGDGEANQLLTIGVGHSFWPAPVYVQASTGFNKRYRGYSDELRYSLEVGGSVRERYSALVRLNGRSSLKNGDSSFVGGTAGLYANDQQYVKVGVELGIALTERLGIAAGVDGVLSAERTLGAPLWSFGVFHTRP